MAEQGMVVINAILYEKLQELWKKLKKAIDEHDQDEINRIREEIDKSWETLPLPGEGATGPLD